MGSTAEGVVDDLVEILKIKKENADAGINFVLHCDAAWGGYLRSMIIGTDGKVRISKDADDGGFVPFLPLSDYAQEQFKAIQYADTVTIDPHKAGLIPYPAGSLCYSDGRLRKFIAFDADYIHSTDDNNMGIYGLEGSKPGAAPVAVYLAHKTVPLNKSGYGLILGECSYSAKLYYCYWLVLAQTEANFKLEPLIQLPDCIPKSGGIEGFDSPSDMIKFIRAHIIGKSNTEIARNPRALLLLREVGADVLMNCFTLNYKPKDSSGFNKDIVKMNDFNNAVFEKFSLTGDGRNIKDLKYILMMNTLASNEYGSALNTMTTKLGITAKPENYKCNVLVNTILQPWPNDPKFVNQVMKDFARGVNDIISKMK